MKTTLHRYSFNISKRDDAVAYDMLCDELIRTPGRGRWLHVIAIPGSGRCNVPDGEVELDTEFLYSNQWNTKCGHRVFDWYEGIQIGNRNLKFGHYLDITKEMINIRDSTLVCGYTGKHYPRSSGLMFNTDVAALGSPYLNEKELYLVRLKPASFTGSREQLTDAERDFLLPQYIKAQTQRIDRESKARVRELHEDYEESVAVAKMERDGFLWLIERGVNAENIIFYKHTKQFGIGWRHPLSASTAKAMIEKIAGFPFQYEIKTDKQ